MFNFKLLRQSILSAALCAGCFTAGVQASETSAEGTLSVAHQGIVHDALYDVCFVGESGLAVGLAGTVLTTGDAGKSWQDGSAKVANAFLGVSCLQQASLVVGQTGLIMRKAGDGDWVKVDSGTDQRLLSVSANESGLAVVVGGFGTVLKSIDAGLTWAPLSFDWEAILNDFYEPHVYDVSVSPEGVITLVGEFDLVLRSVDQGETWDVVNKGDTSLFALHFRDATTGFAVGQDGKVIKTLDGGLSWNIMPVPTKENLLDVWSSGSQVIVTGIRTLLRSSDDGLNWELVTEGDVAVQWYQAVDGTAGDAGEDSVVMVGHSGRIVNIK
ncbi:MAG: hypothetical protein KBT88_09450 [Gammaproteobacteria bacterium]|nr:hypothetical protein [Gammaproteobacteria bacterium]MBQ0840000.1 hypothetical protein [Gammaproteobacteria bacterium]